MLQSATCLLADDFFKDVGGVGGGLIILVVGRSVVVSLALSLVLLALSLVLLAMLISQPSIYPSLPYFS